MSDPHALDPLDEELDALAEAADEELLPRRRRPLGPSPRLRGAALALNLCLGFVGAHRFYVGKIGSGIAQLFTLGGLGLWWAYDLIMIVTGEFTDKRGRRLVHWTRSEATWGGGEARQVSLLTREVESLRAQVSELNERVDFTERLLSRGK